MIIDFSTMLSKDINLFTSLPMADIRDYSWVPCTGANLASHTVCHPASTHFSLQAIGTLPYYQCLPLSTLQALYLGLSLNVVHTDSALRPCFCERVNSTVENKEVQPLTSSMASRTSKYITSQPRVSVFSSLKWRDNIYI